MFSCLRKLWPQNTRKQDEKIIVALSNIDASIHPRLTFVELSVNKILNGTSLIMNPGMPSEVVLKL
jgi:hypothetical protein